jgi:hypothetical protein
MKKNVGNFSTAAMNQRAQTLKKMVPVPCLFFNSMMGKITGAMPGEVAGRL